VEEKTTNSYNLVKRKDTRYLSLHGRSFLRHFGLLPEKRTLHLAKWNDEHDLVELDVDEQLDVSALQTKELGPQKRRPGKKSKSKDLEL
jgi:hypothetical protein